MNLLNPSALWFLLIIPPVVLLYFMKFRRRETPVTTLFLWKKVMQDARVNSFFQKLRINILLILQLLFILFVISAIVRPYFKSLGSLSSETIFIIDASAGMKTLEGRKTRFAIAKEKIHNLIDESKSDSAFMIIAAFQAPEILTGLSSDRDKIISLLRKLEPSETASDLRSAVMLALSIQRSHPNSEIILVGDKLPQDEDLHLQEISSFSFIPIGESNYNTGITSFNISPPKNEYRGEVFVNIENFSDSQYDDILEIYYNDNLSEARKIQIPPQKSKGHVFELPAQFSGTVTAKLPAQDDFSLDNTAYGRVNEQKKQKVLLVSPENLFLERLLSIIPGLLVERIPSLDNLDLDLSPYQIVVWNRSVVDPPLPGSHIFINCVFKGKGIQQQGLIQMPYITGWKREHPLFKHIDMSPVSIAQSAAVTPPVNSLSLMESSEGDLIFYWEEKDFKGIFVLFDLMDSDWLLHPSFPMFMANAIGYLGEKTLEPLSENYKTGETLVLDFLPQEEMPVIHSPSGNRLTLSETSRGYPVLSLEETGFYNIKWSHGEKMIPCSLLNREVSKIKPDPPLRNPQKSAAEASALAMIREIWRELALAALLILLLEWYIFNKRRI